MAKDFNPSTHVKAAPMFKDVEFVVVAFVTEEVADKQTGEIKTVKNTLQSNPIHDTERFTNNNFQVSLKVNEKALNQGKTPTGCSANKQFGTVLYREDGSDSGHSFSFCAMSPAKVEKIVRNNNIANAIFANAPAVTTNADDEAPL